MVIRFGLPLSLSRGGLPFGERRPSQGLLRTPVNVLGFVGGVEQHALSGLQARSGLKHWWKIMA